MSEREQLQARNGLNVAKWQCGKVAKWRIEIKKLAKMVHNSKFFCIFAPDIKTNNIMVVVTGRDFRANTAKYAFPSARMIS